MINAYGTKTAFYGKAALLDLPLKPDPLKRKLQKNIDGESSRTNFEKLPTIKNILAQRLLAADNYAEFLSSKAQMQVVSLSSGEIVYQPNARQNYVYLPETAVFSQLNILEDGRTVETAMIGSEGIAGLSAILGFDSSSSWTQVSVAGTAYRVCADAFNEEFKRGGFLQTAFLDYVNLYIRQISQRAVCNNHHRIEERFSTWLLMLDDRLGTDEKNNLALTQEQIAQFLGVHRPSVTCIAQELRDNGIIDYLRGRIIIRDRPRLQSAACECYSAI